ncbi:MAG: hypothetical protein AAGM46_15145, partial [Cyanobacteria bacterium J06582_2]
ARLGFPQPFGQARDALGCFAPVDTPTDMGESSPNMDLCIWKINFVRQERALSLLLIHIRRIK